MPKWYFYLSFSTINADGRYLPYVVPFDGFVWISPSKYIIDDEPPSRAAAFIAPYDASMS